MSRRSVVAAGAVVVSLYLIGAAVSGRLSPFARGPLLDGLAPVAPYRWVDPPANLADTNKQPTPGRFELSFRVGTIGGGAFQTPDAQVIMIVPHDAFAPKAGQDSVVITVKPVAPSGLSSPPASDVLLGNVVQIQAAYQPSGERISKPKRPIEVALVYPFVASDSGEHLMLESSGGGWETIKATDHVASAQIMGSISDFGDVAAAGKRLPASASRSPSSSGSSGTGTIVAIVVGALLVSVLLVAVFRRGGDRGDRR
jgi:hypothetical protein